jgi:hypothetical protein
MRTVSIGLPVFNAERFLETALNSVLTQTYTNLEIIISDNGSTDRTAGICRAYASSDPRIRYIRHPTNRGASFNHDFVARRATGYYFRWFACDDVMAPTCIEECVRALDRDPGLVLAWPRPTVTNSADDIVAGFEVDLTWEDESSFTRLRSRIGRRADDEQTGWCFPMYGLSRRVDVVKCLPLGPFHGSDQVLLAQLALKGRWVELQSGLFFCRVHDGNSTSARRRHDVGPWMKPGMTPGLSMPAWRRLLGFVRVVIRADLGVAEKARCVGLLAAWPFVREHPRLLWWDLKVLGLELLEQMARREKAAVFLTED